MIFVALCPVPYTTTVAAEVKTRKQGIKEDFRISVELKMSSSFIFYGEIPRRVCCRDLIRTK